MRRKEGASLQQRVARLKTERQIKAPARLTQGIQNSDPSDDSVCSVCLGSTGGQANAAPSLTLPCGHIFHENCITTWLTKKLCCPNCRLQLTKEWVAQEGLLEGAGTDFDFEAPVSSQQTRSMIARAGQQELGLEHTDLDNLLAQYDYQQLRRMHNNPQMIASLADQIVALMGTTQSHRSSPVRQMNDSAGERLNRYIRPAISSPFTHSQSVNRQITGGWRQPLTMDISARTHTYTHRNQVGYPRNARNTRSVTNTAAVGFPSQSHNRLDPYRRGNRSSREAFSNYVQNIAEHQTQTRN